MGNHSGGFAPGVPARPVTLRSHRKARRKIRKLVWVPALYLAAAGAASAVMLALTGSPASSAATGHAVVREMQAPSPAPALTRPALARTPAAAAAPAVYTVRRDDTLWSVAAARCGGGSDWTALAHGNPSVRPFRIKAGERIDLTC